jgi:hypothetical protein
MQGAEAVGIDSRSQYRRGGPQPQGALSRKRATSASAQYAASTTQPRKNPPWQLAQIKNNGGSSHNRRRDSKITAVSARNR